MDAVSGPAELSIFTVKLIRGAAEIDLVEQLPDHIQRKAAADQETEGFFPFFARIGFARQQPELVLQCPAGGAGFESGGFFQSGFHILGGKAALAQLQLHQPGPRTAVHQRVGVIFRQKFVVQVAPAAALRKTRWARFILP